MTASHYIMVLEAFPFAIHEPCTVSGERVLSIIRPRHYAPQIEEKFRFVCRSDALWVQEMVRAPGDTVFRHTRSRMLYRDNEVAHKLNMLRATEVFDTGGSNG